MHDTINSIKELMQEGYNYYISENLETCRLKWIETWKRIQVVFENEKIASIYEFDQKHSLTESMYNWATDFQEVLQNVYDNTTCINFCKWLLPLYNQKDLNLVIAKMAIAESCFGQEKIEEGEEWFRQITNDHPRVDFVWMNWSSQYWLFSKGEKDYKKGEEILLAALEVENIEHEYDIHVRLADLYKETKEIEKLEQVQTKMQLMNSRNIANRLEIPDGETALEKGTIKENVPYYFNPDDKGGNKSQKKVKVGRNDPCPCGSGKKYKKCCLG